MQEKICFLVVFTPFQERTPFSLSITRQSSTTAACSSQVLPVPTFPMLFLSTYLYHIKAFPKTCPMWRVDHSNNPLK